MSSTARPGSSASSRPKSRGGRILTPGSSESSLNKIRHDALSPEAGKRKRESQPHLMEDLLKPIIYVKPQLSVPSSAGPCMLRPLMLLRREHLSLSSLDLSAPHGEFTTGPGRFFESQIRILDLEGRMGSSVLLARADKTRNAYAIERHKNGLYVLCKLGTWVDVEKLSQLATDCYWPRISPITQTVNSEAPRTTPQMHKQDKKKRLAIEELQSMVRKRPRAMSTTPFESQTSQGLPLSQSMAGNTSISPITTLEEVNTTGSIAEPLPPASQSAPTDTAIEAQVTAEKLFENIRSKYTEALYTSMESLAYFAKGSLSRARAAFHLDCDANLEMEDLIDFLKSLVMTASKIDKKYLETIPELIEQMKTLVDSSDDGEPKAKRRRTKKMKLGQDGLYPGEINHIKKWWSARKPDLKDDYESESNDQETKYHISCLRRKETQLQIIIILEILALEALRPAEDALDSQLPGLPVEGPTKVPVTKAEPKKKSKHNFPKLIDIHVDRMCIWQSTTSNDMKMVADSQSLKTGSESQQPSRLNSDPNRDFCIDVILPFFASRLPELCDSLNMKFGGPVALSPPKPKAQSSAASKVPAKPGAATKRPVPAKPRTLQRALTNDQQKRKAARRPNDMLARMRSATPAAIPGFKREDSEPLSVGSIPRIENSSLHEKSRNILSRSVSNASIEDSKAKQKAQTEAELREAISALKKPNRQAVGKVIVEEAEKRTVAGSSHPRKSRKPMRHPLSNVQVKATPANNRYKDALASESRQSFSSLNLPLPNHSSDVIPSSSFIPSTAPRNGLRDDLAAFHIASTPTAEKIKATPARQTMTAPIQHNNNLTSTFFIPPSSPLQARKPQTAATSKVFAIPGTPATRRTEMPPSSPGTRGLFETPVKRRTTTMRDVMDSSPPPIARKSPLPSKLAKFGPRAPPSSVVKEPAPPAVAPAPESKPPRTIYQQMGWDDYDELGL